MFERILMPVDGSRFAERALSQASRIAHAAGSEIVLLRAVHVPLSLARIDTAHLEEAERREATEYVDGLTRRLEAAGLRARAAVLDGPPADVILEAAAREGASLIAMATHGRSGLGRWVMGSVAGKVVQASMWPVLLHRSVQEDGGGEVPVGRGEVPFRRILVPLDGSALAEAVLGPAEALAGLAGAEVIAVHVGPPGGGGVLDRLEAAVRRLGTSGTKARLVRVDGTDAAAGILDVADCETADLIAMSTHGVTGFSRWAFGSVAERVIHSARLPLLVIRPAIRP